MAAPATPSNLTIDKVGSNAIYISWDNVTGELGFNIYRSEDDITYVIQEIIDVDVLTYWDGLVDPSTTYYYKVAAYNADGISALSSAVSDTTLAKDNETLDRSTQGPFPYDQNSLYRNDDEYRNAIRGGQISISIGPTLGTHVVRYEDIKINVVSKTADYTTDFLDLVLCDGDFTVTLPDIATADLGKEIVVVNEGSGIITVEGDGDDLLYGEADMECISDASLTLKALTTSSWVLV